MSTLREPPRGPDNEPVRVLVHDDCPICAGAGILDRGYEALSNISRTHKCSFCGGCGSVLREKRDDE